MLSLLKTCQNCGGEVSTTTKANGTLLSIIQNCSKCSFIFKWDSQPIVKKIPAGNILLSAAILFSGMSPTKVIRMFSLYGCATITNRTFFAHQNKYLQPSVFAVWNQHQTELLKQLHKEKRPLILGGDGRADSPGHSAKFGSYTIMELKQKAVIDVQLVQVSTYYLHTHPLYACYVMQSNEVKGSYHMEMEGLKRAVQLLQKKKFKIGVIVTDRHKQIAKWLKDNLPETSHRFDIWHLAKCMLTFMLENAIVLSLINSLRQKN